MACLRLSPEIISLGEPPDSPDLSGHAVKVILPGSKGLNIRNSNEEFFVEDVFYSPHFKGLAYRGKSKVGTDFESVPRTGTNQDVKTIIALGSLIEIPGESKLGLYNLERGEITMIETS